MGTHKENLSFYIFTSFYVNRRKYSFRENFPLPVFDGFACLEHDLNGK